MADCYQVVFRRLVRGGRTTVAVRRSGRGLVRGGARWPRCHRLALDWPVRHWLALHRLARRRSSLRWLARHCPRCCRLTNRGAVGVTARFFLPRLAPATELAARHQKRRSNGNRAARPKRASGPVTNIGRCEMPSITRKNTGVRKMPKNVTPSMPANTAVPQRAAHLGPGARRDNQRQHAEDESKRRHQDRPQAAARKLAARRLVRSRPPRGGTSRTRRSKSRFLHARPIKTTKPICVKILMSILAHATPAIEHSTHIGTTRITASGIVQLS